MGGSGRGGDKVEVEVEIGAGGGGISGDQVEMERHEKGVGEIGGGDRKRGGD